MLTCIQTQRQSREQQAHNSCNFFIKEMTVDSLLIVLLCRSHTSDKMFFTFCKVLELQFQEQHWEEYQP